MKRTRRLVGGGDWTPRERVELLHLVAMNADWVPDADELLANLRRVISDEECRPETLISEWALK